VFLNIKFQVDLSTEVEKRPGYSDPTKALDELNVTCADGAVSVVTDVEASQKPQPLQKPQPPTSSDKTDGQVKVVKPAVVEPETNGTVRLDIKANSQNAGPNVDS
jgi:hypothetical protein